MAFTSYRNTIIP